MVKYCQCGCGTVIADDKTWVSGHNGRGVKRTDITKKKISESLTGKTRSQEHSNNISKSKKGKKLSLYHRKRISQGGLKRFENPKEIQKNREGHIGELNGRFGHECSLEERIMISCGHQGINREEWTGFKHLENDWRDYSMVEYLNEPFEGCHRHHLSEELVAHIPGELHKSIWHNMKTGKGMGEMNILSLQFIHNEV